MSQARTGIGSYIEFYNTRRPHSSLQARTPDVVYFELAATAFGRGSLTSQDHLKELEICSNEWGHLVLASAHMPFFEGGYTVVAVLSLIVIVAALLSEFGLLDRLVPRRWCTWARCRMAFISGTIGKSAPSPRRS